MRCKRIRFRGYKRLADTSTNVSPRLLAFVGPNEAGKSSVLSGLEWLTEDEDEPTPLDDLDVSRVNRVVDGWIVGAEYRLDADERAALEPLGFERVPEGLSLWKQKDGALRVEFDNPREVHRDPAPFVQAVEALDAAESRLARQFELAETDHNEGEGPAAWMGEVRDRLGDRDRVWDDDDKATAGALADWLDAVPDGAKRPRDAKAAGLLRSVMLIGATVHPRDAGLALMRGGVPRFVMFKDEYRDLPTVTPINSAAVVAGARPAIKNLLTVAGLNATALWRARQSGDSGEVKTLLDAANERLDSFFGQAWNQSKISVRIDVDESGMSAHVYEIENKRYTRVEERSDGLRAFVALAVFLESQHLDVPPILLIDEAETHLHFDAQADLVGVLLKQVKAAQVIYTTHSPGCLPSDLGTGIRLLKRDGVTSTIESHFWANKAPGFGALLFAMGAGAAAFSACRWAVLAEGPSDMILLPTLLRLAAGLNDLPYQIAPGLSNARAYDMNVEEVAARVVYLADGDRDGDRYLKDLRGADVDEGRLFQLPSGVGLEDLLAVGLYLQAVNDVLPADSPEPPQSIAVKGEPIAPLLDEWADAQTPAVKLPSKVAVAYAVLDRIDDGDLGLAQVFSAGVGEVLADLHQDFLAAFGIVGANNRNNRNNG